MENKTISIMGIKNLHKSEYKEVIIDMIEAFDFLIEQGYKHLIINGMKRESALVAQTFLLMKHIHKNLVLEIVVPCKARVDFIDNDLKKLYLSCDKITPIEKECSVFCIDKCKQYIIDRSAAVIGFLKGNLANKTYNLLKELMSQGKFVLACGVD